MWEVKELQSSDCDVKKYIFTKEDAIAEAVLYKYGEYGTRTVMCISTQTGCQMGCTFCGTGKFFGRDLTTEEIVGQVTYMATENDIDMCSVQKLQIMVMSMGEPLNNMGNVAPAFRELHDTYPQAALLVSTSAPKTKFGWAGMMELAKGIPTVGLQFSVHESTDEARDKIMPIKAKLTLNEIARMGEAFYSNTGRRPYFNYCVGTHNNSKDDALRLTALFRPAIWEATLSVICAADEAMADAVSDNVEVVSDFSGMLVQQGFNTRVFNPAGQDDIGGGCGQLWAVQEFAKSNPNFRKSAGARILCREV
jgi:23S rRNA (adenine2503-C2)-methyltransferase